MTFVTAAGTVASNVNEIRGSLPRRGSVVMIRQTERDVLLRQHFQNARGVPTRIAEFKTVPPFIRQHFEKFFKPIGVRLEVRRS
jgi:hypothetical protein